MLKIHVIATFDLSPEQEVEIRNEVMAVIKSLELQSTVFLECVRNYCADRCEENWQPNQILVSTVFFV